MTYGGKMLWIIISKYVQLSGGCMPFTTANSKMFSKSLLNNKSQIIPAALGTIIKDQTNTVVKSHY